MISIAFLLATATLQASETPSNAESPGSSVAAYLPASRDSGDFWRYFFFWKAEVSAEQARSDILECRSYAREPVLWGRIPERMPLDAVVRGPDGTESGYGLVGALAFDVFSGALERRIVLANTRRCMGFKGYRRYGLSAALWRALNEGTAEEVVARLVVVATGPEPSQQSIAP